MKKRAKVEIITLNCTWGYGLKIVVKEFYFYFETYYSENQKFTLVGL